MSSFGGQHLLQLIQFFTKLPYDVLAIVKYVSDIHVRSALDSWYPSHELYMYNVTLDVHKNFVPKLNGRYLSSNANITILAENGGNVSVPVGSKSGFFQLTRGVR